MSELVIVDYGLANLHSVQNAINHLGSQVTCTDKPEVIEKANKIILPGVGSFGEAMTNLEKSGCADAIKKAGILNKPILGICLGMQLFFERSEESPGINGLEMIEGNVKRLDFNITGPIPKLPHICWNKIIQIGKMGNIIIRESELQPFYYFVHSYKVVPDNSEVILTKTLYQNLEFASTIQKGKVFGVQFHPEKSGTNGLGILNNFLKI